MNHHANAKGPGDQTGAPDGRAATNMEVHGAAPVYLSPSAAARATGPLTSTLLECPTCGFEYTHLERVIVATDPAKQYAMDPDGNRCDVGDSPIQATSDRPVFALVGTCVNGHEFAVVFHEHKGHNHISTRVLHGWGDPAPLRLLGGGAK